MAEHLTGTWREEHLFNLAKARALTKRGEQQRRTALWRMSGVDLTRVGGIAARSLPVF